MMPPARCPTREVASARASITITAYMGPRVHKGVPRKMIGGIAGSRSRTILPPEGMKYICISCICISGDHMMSRLTGCCPDSAMDRGSATTFIQRNQPALPNRKNVYLLLGIPNNDVPIADHNTF